MSLVVRAGVVWLLLASSVEAACVTVDTTAWTSYQRDHLLSLAYFVATQAGHDEFPTLNGSQLCFQTFDPVGVVTPGAMLAQAAADQARDARAMVAANAFISEEVNSSVNDLCASADLATISTKLTAIHDTLAATIGSVVSIASAQTVLAQMNTTYFVLFGKLARCVASASRYKVPR